MVVLVWSCTSSASDPSDTSIRPATITEPEDSGETAPATEPADPDRTIRRATITESEEGEASAPAQPSFQEELERKKDFLTLGGLFYQRADLLGSRLEGETRLQPRFPALVNLYLDARPSERLRGFVVGRLVYDPLDSTRSGPQTLLDQFWFSFDLANRVFITAGRQQIKWGSSMLWNPTDFLQQPNPQPLEGIDLRTGVDMVKVNIPWESLGAHLSLMLTADLLGPSEQRLRYGGALRADVAIGDAGEISLTASFLQRRRPRYGLDWSMGVGPVDLNAELALVRDTDVRLWERTAEGFAQRDFGGPKLLASGGMSTQFRLADVFRVGLRLEGFYNPLGYEDRAFLTWLQSTGDYRALFFGRYYGMGQVSLSRRSMYAPTLSLTAVANVSDQSYMSRLEYSMVVMTAVKFFVFVEAPFGARGSEFLFQPDTAVAPLPAVGLGLFRAGINVRMRL